MRKHLCQQQLQGHHEDECCLDNESETCFSDSDPLLGRKAVLASPGLEVVPREAACKHKAEPGGCCGESQSPCRLPHRGDGNLTPWGQTCNLRTESIYIYKKRQYANEPECHNSQDQLRRRLRMQMGLEWRHNTQGGPPSLGDSA